MSEQTSNPTSGQKVPKSKFRRKSRQEQTAASKLRMERRGEKLDAARGKLAKQKPPKKPGAVKRLAHTAGHGVHGFVHGKLYEVEHENVGTEGAHRSELAAESVYRFGRHKLRKVIREHPAKAVERAESKHIKATADYCYAITASFADCKNAAALHHVKQILLSSFANNTAKNSSGDILAIPPEQRDNNSGGSPYVP